MRMPEHDVTTGEILEFLKEHMVMRADFEAALRRTASKEDLAAIMTHVDGLAGHNQKFDQELLMIRNRQDRLEERFAQ